MITLAPKISKVIAEKNPGKPAIFLRNKIVYIGGFSSREEYQKIMKKLQKEHPGAKEEDFGLTFIFGKKNYIL
ncbi:SPOR domain-containing protein [Candidatus Peregrinibacteria bacterium]|nr:SPOR domain-containing protein [Candidatus Peregrinibacteria bacterium]